MLPYMRTQSPKMLGHVLKYEMAAAMSLMTLDVLGADAAERKYTVGEVLGRVLFDIDNIDITPDGGNTGDGALGALTLGAAAKPGVYVVTCVAAAADGGTFAVVDPDGYRLPDAEVGDAYAHPQINFTISDGAADWVVGDSISVTIPEGSGAGVPLDPAAVDGTQRAAGFITENITVGAAASQRSQIIRRDAVAAADGLIWPDGITEDQKAAALAELAALNIQVRTSG